MNSGPTKTELLTDLVIQFLKLGFSVGLAVANFLLKAWVMVRLWMWFVVPFGLPALGMAWMLGIGTFWSLFVIDWNLFWERLEKDKEQENEAFDGEGNEPEDRWVKSTSHSIAQLCGAMLFLAVGWIIHCYM